MREEEWGHRHGFHIETIPNPPTIKCHPHYHHETERQVEIRIERDFAQRTELRGLHVCKDDLYARARAKEDR